MELDKSFAQLPKIRATDMAAGSVNPAQAAVWSVLIIRFERSLLDRTGKSGPGGALNRTTCPGQRHGVDRDRVVKFSTFAFESEAEARNKTSHRQQKFYYGCDRSVHFFDRAAVQCRDSLYLSPRKRFCVAVTKVRSAITFGGFCRHPNFFCRTNI